MFEKKAHSDLLKIPWGKIQNILNNYYNIVKCYFLSNGNLNSQKVNLLYPITFFVICGFLVVLPILDTPELVVIDFAILAVGVLFYLVFIYWKSKPTWLKRILCE